MVTFSEITEKECIDDKYPPLVSKNSNCATLRGHLINNWALALSHGKHHFARSSYKL